MVELPGKSFDSHLALVFLARQLFDGRDGLVVCVGELQLWRQDEWRSSKAVTTGKWVPKRYIARNSSGTRLYV